MQTRGALRRELTQHLRTKRANRRPRGYSPMNGQGQLRNTVHISERPAEANDRAVPGHWEGDLVCGKGMSAIATLVDRQSRFVMLIGLPGDHRSDRGGRPRREDHRTARTTAAVTDLGPRQRDGQARRVHRRHRRARLLLRPALTAGNAAPTRTPTDCSANTCRRRPTCTASPRTDSTRSLRSSTAALDRPASS
ncbi:MAG: transposase [Acidimicrobiia bacterium]